MRKYQGNPKIFRYNTIQGKGVEKVSLCRDSDTIFNSAV